jgi:hypothetical protein
MKMPFGLPAFVLLLTPLAAQMQDNQEKTLTCNEHNGGHRLSHACEVKEQALPAPQGIMEISPGMNGGLSIKGWNRPDVLVRARIDTAAPTEAEAKSMISNIRVTSGSGHIVPEGPATDEDHNWSVSYEVFVPHQIDISGTTHNGGVRIQDLKGHINFKTENGGVHLARVGGDISGATTNGGVRIELAGDHWDGKGLDVRTTNGGVRITVPANYSAHFETSTVNGGTHSDFVTSAQTRHSKDLSFDSGTGGASIRATTTNGGVHVSRL